MSTTWSPSWAEPYAVLSFERQGSGPPLVLLHGTNSSRAIWNEVTERLAAKRELILVDLPGHGASPATSLTPQSFAMDIAGLFDALGLVDPPVVGHSAGGWTALELAKLGRSRAVLALAPAGLWRHRSPLPTDIRLCLSWAAARLTPDAVLARAPRQRVVRALGLSVVSARPGDVSVDQAVRAARNAKGAAHFPEHFRATRVLRFQGGGAISATTPVTIVWGDRDRIALARRSRFEDELPGHRQVQTWKGCGHAVMWDRPDETVKAALAIESPWEGEVHG